MISVFGIKVRIVEFYASGEMNKRNKICLRGARLERRVRIVNYFVCSGHDQVAVGAREPYMI